MCLTATKIKTKKPKLIKHNIWEYKYLNKIYYNSKNNQKKMENEW